MSSVPIRPNLLLLLPDQHRFDWLGTNPSLPLRTPNLDALGARGIRFTRAICASPLCAPSRACLASGREYERCGVQNNKQDYPLSQPTYYQQLRATGYRVAGVGKFDLRKATFDWGPQGTNLLQEWGFTEGIDNEGKMDAIASAAGRAAAAAGNSAAGPDLAASPATATAVLAPPGAADTTGSADQPPRLQPKGPYMTYLIERGLAQAHVDDFRRRRANRGLHPTPLPDDAYCDNWIAANGLRFLERFPTDQPWHLQVNFNGPHSPMDVTESMQRRWRDVQFPPPVASTQEDLEHQAIRQNYAAMIENIDSHVGRFLDLVKARGELDRTIIIYSSDHGEMLGDHDRWGKTMHYQPSVGVPFIVAGPGVQNGLLSDALVSMHDVAATFLDYAAAASLPGMDSRSLRPVLEGQSRDHRHVARSGLDSWRMVWDGRFKLVRDAASADGSQPSQPAQTLLFDLEHDPHELENVAGRHPDVVERLTPQLRP